MRAAQRRGQWQDAENTPPQRLSPVVKAIARVRVGEGDRIENDVSSDGSWIAATRL